MDRTSVWMEDGVEVTVVMIVMSDFPSPWPSDTAHIST